MSPPPPAEGFASRLLLGPALRTQSDRRLVSMVRDGYETAFEEIVRRYGRALGRYAGAIVPGHRAEDVTQDAFSKALLALRQSDAEIELRPWLYRIVRNTALNDLRDEPPTGETPEDLGEGSASAFQEVARRQEVADLMERLRALPEPQRAAIVMRELEGLSHEEIAAALGITGGAARQVIYRARRALRDGLGILVPLPLIKLMLGGGAASASAAGAAFGGGAGGGAGAGLAIKATAATLLVAGGVGTGVVLHEADTSPAERRATVAGKNADKRATRLPAGSTAPIVDDSVGGGSVAGDDRDDEDNSGPGSSGSDDGSDSSGSGSGADDGDRDREEDREDSSGPGSGDEPDSEESGSGEPDSSGSRSDGTGSDFLDSSGSETDLLDSSGTGSMSDAEAEAVDD